jgi:hypothetical protein
VFTLGLAWSLHAAPKRPSGVDRHPTLSQDEPERARGEVPGSAAMTYGPVRRGSSVYPQQDIPLRFNHGQHLALGLSCQKCHTKIDDSRRSRDFNFPTGAACDECHGEQHPRPAGVEKNCALCHTEVDDAGRVTAGLRAPRPQLSFNHQMHMTGATTCEDCHGDMSKVRLATTLQLPREADCLTCHDGFQATQRCGACHPSSASGRLQTRAADDRALPALVPTGASAWGAEHDLAFVEDHAGPAKSNPKLCETCHDETMCTDCHAGSIRPMRIHAGDFLSSHALESQSRTSDCQACHRTQTFCLGCHERVGFGDRVDGEFAVGGSLRFHPEGFSGPPGMPQTHAFAAQRNIASCTSCHDEDSCLACHATTDVGRPGLDVSPHGAGFADSARCSALAARNRRVCLKCHAPGDPRNDCG